MHQRHVSSVYLAITVLACAPSAHPRPRLPAASGTFRHVDNTLVFELPDTGGYLVNTIAADTARLVAVLHEVFDSRPQELRAVFVHDNPKRAWSDVEVLVRKAREAGVAIFDADSSGFRRDFQTIPSQ